MKIELDLSEEEAKIILRAQSLADLVFVHEEQFVQIITKIKEAIKKQE